MSMTFIPLIPQDLRTTASPTFANLYDSGLTSGRVTYAGASGLLTDSSNLTFDGTNLTCLGNITLDSDSGKLYLGADQDSYIYDDGTDLIIDADVLTSGSKELRLNPNGGDIHLFDTKVLNGSTDGYKLYLHNMGEGASNAGSIYIDQYGRLHLDSPNDDVVFSAAGSVQFESIAFNGAIMYTVTAELDIKANNNQTDIGRVSFYPTQNWKVRFEANEDSSTHDAYFYNFDISTTTGNLTIGGLSTLTGGAATGNIEPITDDTYYLGRNDDDSPKAWKGIVLKDQAGTGKYYRIEVSGDALQIVDLTD